MILSKYIYCILIILSLFFISSCKDTNEYRVETSFKEYLHRFEIEAAKRNMYFYLQSTGLIIEFADLKDNTAGLTHFENPIRIEIDKSYWKNISAYAGADIMKEELIFHELGHGLLGRKHLNETLENGDWKSIMCGGEKVNGRPWNINYKGMRRDYYIDELFNQSTPAPEFASTQLLVDTAGNTSKLFLSFDTEAQAGWKIIDSVQYKTCIDNGRLKFESKVGETYLVYVNTSIDIQSDITFEFTIEFPFGDINNQYGLIFGYVPPLSNGVKDPVEYFTVNNNRKMYMGNRSWYSFFTELPQSAIIAHGKNKLKIVKIGRILYYFINNIYTYKSEIEVNESGNNFGFMVPPNGTVYIDNFNIAQKPTLGTTARIIQMQNVEFEVKSTKSFNNNIIFKK